MFVVCASGLSLLMRTRCSGTSGRQVKEKKTFSDWGLVSGYLNRIPRISEAWGLRLIGFRVRTRSEY